MDDQKLKTHYASGVEREKKSQQKKRLNFQQVTRQSSKGKIRVKSEDIFYNLFLYIFESSEPSSSRKLESLKTARKKNAKSEFRYKMNHESRGKCVIFCQVNFDNNWQTLEVNELDVKRIEKTFKTLEFDIEVHMDLTVTRIESKIADCKQGKIFFLTYILKTVFWIFSWKSLNNFAGQYQFHSICSKTFTKNIRKSRTSSKKRGQIFGNFCVVKFFNQIFFKQNFIKKN